MPINKKNILSFQSRIGNITSLNNNDVLIDNKFSLGGRWLRGFDLFGAEPVSNTHLTLPTSDLEYISQVSVS